MNSLEQIKIKIFLYVTKLFSILYINSSKFLIYLLMKIPNKYYLSNSLLPITYDSDLESDSDSESEEVNSSFPIDTELCINISNKIIKRKEIKELKKFNFLH